MEKIRLILLLNIKTLVNGKNTSDTATELKTLVNGKNKSNTATEYS